MANTYFASITEADYTTLLANTFYTTGVANGAIHSFEDFHSLANTVANTLSVANTQIDALVPGMITDQVNSTFMSAVGTTGWLEQQYLVANVNTDSANVTWNCQVEQVKDITLTGNANLDRPTNMKAGATYVIMVRQDATGSRLLTYANNYVFSSNIAPTLSTVGTTVDIISGISNGSYIYCSLSSDFLV